MSVTEPSVHVFDPSAPSCKLPSVKIWKAKVIKSGVNGPIPPGPSKSKVPETTTSPKWTPTEVSLISSTPALGPESGIHLNVAAPPIRAVKRKTAPTRKAGARHLRKALRDFIKKSDEQNRRQRMTGFSSSRPILALLAFQEVTSIELLFRPLRRRDCVKS